MSATYQYSGFIRLCNNSDKILALLLQQCYKIITSNNNFALIFCSFLMKISLNENIYFYLWFPFNCAEFIVLWFRWPINPLKSLKVYFSWFKFLAEISWYKVLWINFMSLCWSSFNPFYLTFLLCAQHRAVTLRYFNLAQSQPAANSTHWL